MTIDAQHWEHQLLSLAWEGLGNRPVVPPVQSDGATLAEAYAACSQITRENSRTFYLASSLLPSTKRDAVRALYAFSRISDDIVDISQGGSLSELYRWRDAALHFPPRASEPVTIAWADTRRRFDIPTTYAEQLIEGIARDVLQNRYNTFSDLATYCYGVPCTVGLMSMHITGFAGSDAIPYAIRLGVALQLTNILRDVGEDWRFGRMYLPLDELHAFNLDEEDISLGVVTPQWRDFMKYQISRVRYLYESAFPGIRLLDPDGRFAIAAAGELYQGILDDIEQNGYDVFTRRAHLSATEKILRLPSIWVRARFSRP